MAKTEFPERAAVDNPEAGYLVVQRNLEFLRDAFDAKYTAVVVTGSRGGNAALASLLTQLDSLGIIDNQTT